MFNKPRIERPSHEVSCQCAMCKEYWGQAVSEGGGKWEDVRSEIGGGKHYDHTWTTSKTKGKAVEIPVFKSCVHDGSQGVHTLSTGTVLYGARAMSVMDQGAKLGHLDMILDCSGQVKGRKFVTSGGRRALALNRYAFPEVLSLHWPDMSAPTYVGREFWERLLAILPHAVCVTCIGSHGRTGTALACLMVADGMVPSEAIDLVRTKHCRSAIETAGQEAYVKSLGTKKVGV